MAGIRITELPDALGFNAGDQLAIARSGETYRVNISTLIPVVANNIASNAVTTIKIADNAVTTTKINNNAVTEAKISNNNVTTPKINDNAVTLAKIQTIGANTVLGNNTGAAATVAAVQVATGMIADSAVTTAKINNNAVTVAKMQTIPANRLLGNNTGATANVGAVQVNTNMLENGVVTTAKINDNAVTAAKIQTIGANTVLGNNTGATNNVGAVQVATGMIADSAVTTAKINNSAVTTAKINDNAVTVAKIQTIGANRLLGNNTGAVANVGAVQVNTNMLDTTVLQRLIPPGGIIMWSGTIANIPAGWALCNGLNGTPDLRDRFIVGAGNTYAVGATGGANTVTLTVAQMPSHNHAITDPGHTHNVISYAGISSGSVRINSATICCGSGPTTSSSTTGITINNRGSDQAHENRPPYYALAYIMKL
jgi:hypothetical protein